MNSHIALEITNEILVTKNFASTCKVAAMKDDGMIDRNEQKILDEINKECDKFV